MNQKELKRILHYSEHTGVFTWRVRPCQAVMAGTVAGCFDANGYRLIKIAKVIYKAHRLAWLYKTGRWPKHQIDHINGKRSDNRFANLRDVTGSVNKQNLRKAQANNISGFLGVNKRYGRYNAAITIDGKLRHLGAFDTPEEAHAIYLSKKRQHHEGCTI